MLSSSELDRLKEFRQKLHKHPELSGQEQHTAKLISEFVNQCSPGKVIQNIGGHGIAAIWHGKEKGKTVLIRAELDALPIQESNDFNYKSANPGISHKCGHDGHMVILCGLAMILQKSIPDKGSIILLFQPAEETGEGARKVLADPEFKALAYDHAFALHNLPKKKLATVFCKPGSFCAASSGLKVKFKGKTAHASQPQTGISPTPATVQFIQNIDSIPDNAEFTDKTLITVTHSKIGSENFGVSAGDSEVWVTLRAFAQHDFELLKALVLKEAHRLSKRYDLALETSFHESFEATENHRDAVAMVQNSAESNHLDYQTMSEPNAWSEDFGLFLKSSSGAMFGLGSGVDTPDLHNPDYDFPDTLTEPGVKMFWCIIEQILTK